MKRMINPFEIPGKWYKANLHVHTTTSDSHLSPAERVVQYRNAGYHVLALTDHFKTNDIRGLSDKRMLVISGLEYHPVCPTTKIQSYDLIALNVPHCFSHSQKEQKYANRCIARVKRAGGLTVLAHPYWWGQSYEDFKKLKGLEAIEVYNGGADTNGWGSSENEWAYAIEHGMVLPAIGVDDAHDVCPRLGGDVFNGWTWLRMPSLTVANVLQSVRTGACYASCGPKIHYFGLRDGKVRLRCSAAIKIQFISRPPMGRTREAAEGKVINRFSTVPTQFHKDWHYVRAVVTDPFGRKAWSNPIILGHRKV